MNNTTFKFDIDISKYTPEINELIEKRMREKIGREIHEAFHEAIHFDHEIGKLSSKKGDALTIIENKINEIMTSDDFQKKIESLIEQKWQEIFTKAIEAAIMHKARGFAFNKIPEYEGIMADLIKKAAKASDE